MAYAKIGFTDRNVQFPTRFTLTDNGDGTYTLTPSPGIVTAAGTPLSKANLDHLETQYDEAVTVALLKSLFTAAGSLITSTGASTPSELAKGTARQALQMNAGATAMEWVTSLAGLLTAQGDLVYASAANTLARLAKGTARQQLSMNSGATAPEWVASLQSLLTAAGDIIYASDVNTPARLAKGTALQYLKMNAGATAPEWASLTGVAYAASGTYAGDNTSNRTISLSFTPKLVILSGLDNSGVKIVQIGLAVGSAIGTQIKHNTSPIVDAATAYRPLPVANGFQVGDTGNFNNISGNTYGYVAIG